jgi:caffeoyl-CoA O-methyltransferase
MSIFNARPEITNTKVEEYLYGVLGPRDPVLTILEKDAEKNAVPIVGPLVGNFLSLIAESVQAKNILEIGTATGYSGIWLGRVAKKNGGKLTTIESDPSRVKIAKKSFQDAGISDSVEVLQGDARVEVPKTVKSRSGSFDVAFIDVGDKSLYTDLLDNCVKSLRNGGFLLADNTLWSGRVVDPSQNDPDTKALREFNKRVSLDKRLHPAIIPLRDGVTAALKLAD